MYFASACIPSALPPPTPFSASFYPFLQGPIVHRILLVCLLYFIHSSSRERVIWSFLSLRLSLFYVFFSKNFFPFLFFSFITFFALSVTLFRSYFLFISPVYFHLRTLLSRPRSCTCFTNNFVQYCFKITRNFTEYFFHISSFPSIYPRNTFGTASI